MKHLKKFKKQYLQPRYLIGSFLLLAALVTVLFFINRPVVAPQDEIEVPEPDQKTIDNDWRCPANAWLNCEPSDEQNDECDPEYIQWAQEQCEGFQGAAY